MQFHVGADDREHVSSLHASDLEECMNTAMSTVGRLHAFHMSDMLNQSSHSRNKDNECIGSAADCVNARCCTEYAEGIPNKRWH